MLLSSSYGLNKLTSSFVLDPATSVMKTVKPHYCPYKKKKKKRHTNRLAYCTKNTGCLHLKPSLV